MKSVIFVLASFLVVFSGCSKQSKDYPNVNYSQIIADVKWGSGIDAVKALLEEKYQLEFKQELKQNKPDTKAFEFSGGKVEGINTASWVACFTRDSLNFLVVKVESGSADECEKQFRKILNGTEKVSFRKISNAENEWTFFENETAKCRLQLIKQEKGIGLLFVSSEFIKPAEKTIDINIGIDLLKQ